MLPRLDVDFHLAPFVDERDHFGAAAARVRIGAPHFEREREFWVRAVRAKSPGRRIDLLLRSTQEEKETLLLLTNFLEFSYFGPRPTTELELPLPESLCEKVEDYLEFGQFERYWHHQTAPCAASLIYSKAVLPHPDLSLVKAYRLTDGTVENHNYKSPVEFAETEVFDWQTRQLDDCLTRQFAQQNSELHLTWNWLQIPRNKRFEAFFARPEWIGFLDLMNCILSSEALRNPEIAQSGADWHFLQNGNQQLKLKNTHQSCDARRVAQWGKAILNFYQRRETRQPTPQLMSLHSYQLHRLKCAAPSHHQMLEARLQLHAWARANLTHEEAKQLIALDDLT